MGQSVVVSLLVIQVIVIFSLIGIIIYIINARHNIALERKFNKYTISPLNRNEVSIFDKIHIFISDIIKKVSNVLSKFKVLNQYAKTYEKHITYDELDYKKGIDFISIKFLLGFLSIILYLITQMFQYTEFSFLGIILSFIIGFFLIDIYLSVEYRKKRKKISEDLLKAIIIMNNAFKSGMSIMQAIEIVKNELDGAIGDEFKKIYLDMSYGLTIETVFDRFYNRVKLEETKFITTSLTLLNKTGGNIVKVFKSIEREFFDRQKLNDELKTTTASSTFVYRILLVIPLIICSLIFILNPSYFLPLYKTKIGIMISMLILTLYVLYVIIIKRIMRVDV